MTEQSPKHRERHYIRIVFLLWPTTSSVIALLFSWNQEKGATYTTYDIAVIVIYRWRLLYHFNISCDSVFQWGKKRKKRDDFTDKLRVLYTVLRYSWPLNWIIQLGVCYWVKYFFIRIITQSVYVDYIVFTTKRTNPTYQRDLPMSEHDLR